MKHNIADSHIKQESGAQNREFALFIFNKSGKRSCEFTFFGMSLPCSVDENTNDEITKYLTNMEKFRQDDLDAFDESIMEAKASMGSDCVEHRELRAKARADRHNKTISFQKAVSRLQMDHQMCQNELTEVRQELQLAKLQLQMAVPKDVPTTTNV